MPGLQLVKPIPSPLAVASVCLFCNASFSSS